MYDIYRKPIRSYFAGVGEESLIVKDGIILAHVRGWDDPAVVEEFTGHLQGKPIAERGKGWQKMRGTSLDEAQGWADEIVVQVD